MYTTEITIQVGLIGNHLDTEIAMLFLVNVHRHISHLTVAQWVSYGFTNVTNGSKTKPFCPLLQAYHFLWQMACKFLRPQDGNCVIISIIYFGIGGHR